MAEEWPTELHDTNEWAEVIKKPDALYLPPGSVFIDGAYAGECGETEIIPAPPPARGPDCGGVHPVGGSATWHGANLYREDEGGEYRLIFEGADTPPEPFDDVMSDE